MDAHEIQRGECKASVTLTAHDGTKINFTNAIVRVTNKYLRVVAKPTTYTVIGRGDRTISQVKIPILHCQPHQFKQPWFGPYKWETRVSGPAPEGIEPQMGMWSVHLTFNDGGAFQYRQDFLQAFGAAAQAAQEGVPEVLPAYEA